MKKSVTLVAAANGLGHARRLIYFGRKWESEASITLMATRSQLQFLLEELRDLVSSGLRINTVEIMPIGLQGPQHVGNSYDFAKIPTEIGEIIRKSDIVVSDNALWPLLFNSESFIMGHFLWTDHLKSIRLGEGKISSDDEKLLEFETCLTKQITRSIVIADFAFGQIVNLPRAFRIKLPTYDLRTASLPRREDLVLLSVGKTGLHKIDDAVLKKVTAGKRVIVTETYNLSNLGFLPDFVIGRPGLGTIRDCIELGIRFFPVSATDIELINNVRVINQNSLKSENGTLLIHRELLSEIPSLDDILRDNHLNDWD